MPASEKDVLGRSNPQEYRAPQMSLIDGPSNAAKTDWPRVVAGNLPAAFIVFAGVFLPSSFLLCAIFSCGSCSWSWLHAVQSCRAHMHQPLAVPSRSAISLSQLPPHILPHVSDGLTLFL